jgi:hypothetical protein
VIAIALATWRGLAGGVALGGGGITVGHLAALSLQLAFFGFATGAIALALGAGTGRWPTESLPPWQSSAG